MSEPIPYAFEITDTLPVVRTVIAQAQPTTPDGEILQSVMRAVRGFANPEKVREQIQAERRKMGGHV